MFCRLRVLPLNGCFSVVSTLLATVIAVEMGFAWVMILAALAYGFAFFGFNRTQP